MTAAFVAPQWSRPLNEIRGVTMTNVPNSTAFYQHGPQTLWLPVLIPCFATNKRSNITWKSETWNTDMNKVAPLHQLVIQTRQNTSEKTVSISVTCRCCWYSLWGAPEVLPSQEAAGLLSLWWPACVGGTVQEWGRRGGSCCHTSSNQHGHLKHHHPP